MLLGKRPRPPIMRRTKSMSGGMSVDIQEPDQPSPKPINLEAHHEEIVISNHHNPLHPHPHHHDQDIIKLDPPTVVMETLTGIHGGSMVPNDLTNTDLVGNTVMFPNSTTITNNNHNHNLMSAHVIDSTPHFLRTCSLCNCRLAPGRDIYMYRGDTAFCSLECREQQMKQDKRIEKWKVAVSNKEGHRVSPPCMATVKASTKNQTATCT